jgi:carboxyl-terminal processing protease
MLREATPYGRELALKLTVAEYRVAGDRRIQTAGVRPDVTLLPLRLTEFAGVAQVYDLERFERAREIERTRHLPSAIHETGDAFVSESPHFVRFLDGGDRSPDGMDREVALAHALLGHLKGGDAGTRAQALERMQPGVEAMKAEEEQKILAAFSKWSVDWSGDDRGGDTPLAVIAQILEPGLLSAGQPFTLRVEVENRGSSAVSRVHAITDCAQDELDGIELVFGRLAPGEKRFQEVKLRVMPWHASASDQIVVQAHGGMPDGSPDGQASALLEIVAAERPWLALDAWIVDDPHLARAAPKRPDATPIPGEVGFEVRGNGDGQLQPGERVLLAFRAHNDGPASSPDARVTLRNFSGAQGLIEDIAFPLGEVRAGTSREGAFGISVAEGADPALPFELELTLGDMALRESVSERMRLAVKADGEPFVAHTPTSHVSIEAGATVYSGASHQAPSLGRVDPGHAVRVSGSAGEFAGYELPGGRRVFVSKADIRSGKGPGAKALRRSIDPPRVEIAPTPRRVSNDRVKITGRATHPDGVRDVVVRVRGAARGARERKVDYRPGSGTSPQVFDLSFDVAIEPGGNRIAIIARDGRKIERRRDVWVVRDQGAGAPPSGP